MVLRRILAEAISQATEASRQPVPMELFDLQSIRPEPVAEAFLQRSRDVEAAATDTQRAERAKPIATPVALRRRHIEKVRRADIVAGLKLPDAVRRALVLREILGPPRSISGWDD